MSSWPGRTQESQRHAPPVALVIFGASGDLTSRKILPALERLVQRGAIRGRFGVVGVGRTPLGDEEFRRLALEAVPGHGPDWKGTVSAFRFVSGRYDDPGTYHRLATALRTLDEERGTRGNRLYYAATAPAVFEDVARHLGDGGLSRPARPDSFARLVIEKPFGRDLESARALDDVIHGSFDEDQVYRIDHYLGKETVQNVLALRFANAIFEPIWNRRYVDHVQLTVAESLGVEHRGGFYETAGALRDIVQNHVLQVLALTLMEPPATVDDRGIRDEKVKLLRAVEILAPGDVATSVVRGQYDSGVVDDEPVRGYRQELGVDPASATETFVAMRMFVDNWRWAGVPIYVRTGKRLATRVTEVATSFVAVPHLPFAGRLVRGLGPNTLVLRIQPDEGITLCFGAKVPGQEFEIRSVSMDFSYGATFTEETPDAYERLLLDAMVGDPVLFIRSDEVEQSWTITAPVLEAWETGQAPLARYASGTWGPPASDVLLARDGRAWREP
jgi:glucose-6-phosphate 1-dehydrogenase